MHAFTGKPRNSSVEFNWIKMYQIAVCIYQNVKDLVKEEKGFISVVLCMFLTFTHLWSLLSLCVLSDTLRFSLTVFSPLLVIWSCHIKVIHALNLRRTALFFWTSKSREYLTQKWKLCKHLFDLLIVPNLYDWHAFMEHKMRFKGEWKTSVTIHFHCTRFASGECEWRPTVSFWHVLCATEKKVNR